MSKKHKLYYREKSDVLKNLKKASPVLYVFAIDYMINQGGNAEYAEKNKDVKSWQKFKPVETYVPNSLKTEFTRICKETELVLSYNGSWRPLLKLKKV